MARWEGFRKCPGCGYDFATGEGERSCSWGDCPYLPEELDVLCAYCRFNYFTMEGNPTCDDPMACPHGEEPLAHIENLRAWRASDPAPAEAQGGVSNHSPTRRRQDGPA